MVSVMHNKQENTKMGKLGNSAFRNIFFYQNVQLDPASVLAASAAGNPGLLTTITGGPVPSTNKLSVSMKPDFTGALRPVSKGHVKGGSIIIGGLTILVVSAGLAYQNDDLRDKIFPENLRSAIIRHLKDKSIHVDPDAIAEPTPGPTPALATSTPAPAGTGTPAPAGSGTPAPEGGDSSDEPPAGSQTPDVIPPAGSQTPPPAGSQTPPPAESTPKKIVVHPWTSVPVKIAYKSELQQVHMLGETVTALRWSFVGKDMRHYIFFTATLKDGKTYHVNISDMNRAVNADEQYRWYLGKLAEQGRNTKDCPKSGSSGSKGEHGDGNGAGTPPNDKDDTTYVPPKDKDDTTYIPPDDKDDTTFVPPDDKDDTTFVPPGGDDVTYIPPDDKDDTTYVPPDNGDGTGYVPPDDKDEVTFTPPDGKDDVGFVPPDNDDTGYVPPDEKDDIGYVPPDIKDEVTFTPSDNEDKVTYTPPQDDETGFNPAGNGDSNGTTFQGATSKIGNGVSFVGLNASTKTYRDRQGNLVVRDGGRI